MLTFLHNDTAAQTNMEYFFCNNLLTDLFNDTICLRRTESARNLLVGLIKQLKANNKQMMFRYMQEVRLYPHSFENFARVWLPGGCP